MTVLRIVQPVHVVECDYAGCAAVFRSARPGGFNETAGDNPMRGEAQDAGWQVRPFRGKGSRTLPDYCPQHRTT